MKKNRIIALLLVMVICVCSFTACSSRNMQEELVGEWYIWHWYYNTEGGEDGFFDEAQFYTFDADGNLTIKIGDETTTATYEFTSKDNIEVVYADGTTDTFQLIPSERNGVNQIQFMNVNTIYTLTLEPMSSWTE